MPDSGADRRLLRGASNDPPRAGRRMPRLLTLSPAVAMLAAGEVAVARSQAVAAQAKPTAAKDLPALPSSAPPRMAPNAARSDFAAPPPQVHRRTRDLTLITAAAATLATLAVSFVHLEFTYTSRELRVSLETAQALVGFLVTHLLYGRFKRSGLRADLVLVYGMGLFSAANLFFLLGPIFGPRLETSAFHAWAPLGTRTLAASAIAAAAWMPRRHVGGRIPPALVLGLHVASLLVITATVAIVQDHLPLAVVSPLSTAGGEGPVGIEGHPVLEAAQIVLMGLFWLAAAGFVRHADSKPGPLTTALAVGFVLAGFSRLSYFQDPSLYTDVIYFADLLRLGCYLVLLAGAREQISLYWEGLSQAAVQEERRRTARDLHDGVVQEVSFIRSRVATLASGHGDDLVLEQISSAAERALVESRHAVEALSGADEDVAVTLRRAAEEVATRAGARLDLEIQMRVDVRPDILHALSRIVREACTNAVCHGKARHIAVCLHAGRRAGVHLTVTDDGRGFSSPEGPLGGFGLTSMRERAEGVGGRFRMTSAPGEGTTVEVVIPGHAATWPWNRP